ncbi:TF2L1-like protein [Mya arenaria]|uniref:TF2L1-like protein n=1 Tax=Mya arenaria TaxID=6604 RepID=A0ABY7EBZ4_MYAAR|nr:TF2L1-like protein [Mya arenaria]
MTDTEDIFRMLASSPRGRTANTRRTGRRWRKGPAQINTPSQKYKPPSSSSSNGGLDQWRWQGQGSPSPVERQKSEPPSPFHSEYGSAIDVPECMHVDATAKEVTAWLQANRFSNYINVFQNFAVYNAVYLEQLSYAELMQKISDLINIQTQYISEIVIQGPSNIHIILTDEVVRNFPDHSRFWLEVKQVLPDSPLMAISEYGLAHPVITLTSPDADSLVCSTRGKQRASWVPRHTPDLVLVAFQFDLSHLTRLTLAHNKLTNKMKLQQRIANI